MREAGTRGLLVRLVGKMVERTPVRERARRRRPRRVDCWRVGMAVERMGWVVGRGVASVVVGRRRRVRRVRRGGGRCMVGVGLVEVVRNRRGCERWLLDQRLSVPIMMHAAEDQGSSQCSS